MLLTRQVKPLLGTVEKNSCLCSVGKMKGTPIKGGEGRRGGGGRWGQVTGHGNGKRLRLSVECRSKSAGCLTSLEAGTERRSKGKRWVEVIESS